MKLAVILSLAALALAAVITAARSIAKPGPALLWCPVCDGLDAKAECECPHGCGMPVCPRYAR